MIRTSRFYMVLALVVASAWGAPAWSDGDTGVRRHRVNVMEVLNKRPYRREGPLRQINVTDDEVREIEVVVRALRPGALVNIGGVTVGCPCEDGPDCTEQVWVVDERPDASVGLMLSRISDDWQLGPVQRWFLDYRAYMQAWHVPGDLEPAARKARQQSLIAGRRDLFESFPVCVDNAAESLAAGPATGGG